jgi:hypothetical protein
VVEAWSVSLGTVPASVGIYVLTRQGLDEHINTFVPVLVSAGSEQVDGVLQVKVIVAVEVASDEVVNLLLGLDVQVLELVHRGELDHIQTVGQDPICSISCVPARR